MPRHNRPDLADRLRRIFDVDPPGGFDTIGPEVVPVFPVHLDEASGPRYLGFAAGSFDITPAAGEFGAAILHNPAASGLVLDHVRLSCWHTDAARQVVRIVRNGALGTPLSTRFYHPSRSLLTSTGASVTQDDLVAASLTQVVRLLAIPADRTAEISLPNLALYPGSGIGFMATTANVRIAGDFNWRERPQEAFEFVP